MSSGGGSTGGIPTSGTTSGTSTQNLAAWAQEPAKATVAALMNYIFPGATVPSGWFGNKGFSFPTGGGGSFGGGGATGNWQQAQQNIANSPLQQTLNDPIQNALLSPMVSGSPFLQNIAATNPTAIWGATSPAASQQLGSQYGPQSMQGLSWIPYFNPGPFTGTNTGTWSWPYATGGGTNPNQGRQTAGASQVG